MPAVVSGTVPVRLQQHHLAAARPVAATLPIKVVTNGVNSTGDTGEGLRRPGRQGPSHHSPKRPGRQEGRRQHAEEHRRHLGQGDRPQGRRRPGRASSSSSCRSRTCRPRCEAGQVDAIFVVEPFLSAALAKGWKMIGTYADVDPNLCVALYFTSHQLIADQPRPGHAVHRGDEGVAGLRRRPPGRGPRGPRHATRRSPRRSAASLTLPKWPPDDRRGRRRRSSATWR